MNKTIAKFLTLVICRFLYSWTILINQEMHELQNYLFLRKEITTKKPNLYRNKSPPSTSKGILTYQRSISVFVQFTNSNNAYIYNKSNSYNHYHRISLSFWFTSGTPIICLRYMAEILPIRRKKLSNQSIINLSFLSIEVISKNALTKIIQFINRFPNFFWYVLFDVVSLAECQQDYLKCCLHKSHS